MMLIKVPIIAVVIGEGGSGGALGIGVANSVMMMENSYYSVISPEGCAAILWKHRKHAPEAAEAMRLTAKDLKQLGIVDHVIPEPEGGAHADVIAAASNLKDAVLSELRRFRQLSTGELLNQRYQKFRAAGEFLETTV